ncbi:hypothetical protein GGX14DRAFT_662661 [Mycena pura]|uniref:Uncharacterized protein n=1 Tax=Mycena pura TaxID=153505 RepID=A0AAD6YJG1_9AGAR|nr:hypothetical protein GGX14DRAFT_662661 [Mycena pura]
MRGSVIVNCWRAGLQDAPGLQNTPDLLADQEPMDPAVIAVFTVANHICHSRLQNCCCRRRLMRWTLRSASPMGCGVRVPVGDSVGGADRRDVAIRVLVGGAFGEALLVEAQSSTPHHLLRSTHTRAQFSFHAAHSPHPCPRVPWTARSRHPARPRTWAPPCRHVRVLVSGAFGEALLVEAQVRALLSFVFDGIFTEDRQELDAASFAALDTHAHSSVCTRRSPPTRVRTCHGPHALAILRPHAHGHLHVGMTQRARRRGPHRLQPPASRMQSCS